MSDNSGFFCPLPIDQYPRVLMVHGSGGRRMQNLIGELFYRAFANPLLVQNHDATVLDIPAGRLAMTTDSYVVRPLIFPGGDIGKLAVWGTVNDLAMAGAKPLYLSAGFILEEGLSMDTLWQVVQSMAGAASEAGVQIICGDTKVVESGHGDGVYINTSGVGLVEAAGHIHPSQVQAGQAILVSGDVGRHGMAVLCQRQGLQFEPPIESDCMALWPAVQALLHGGIRVACLRDVTRGGLAAVLNEIAEASALELVIDDAAIPVSEPVRNACELLGLDALQVACEGRFVAFVDTQQVEAAVQILNAFAPQKNAACIGIVKSGKAGRVTIGNAYGGSRVLDMPSGELLPRIC